MLLRALDLLGGELASSSRQRALSTLRGFCGWLVRRHHLLTNPCDAPELRVKRSSSGEVLSFRPDDLERLLAVDGGHGEADQFAHPEPTVSVRRGIGTLRGLPAFAPAPP